MVFMSIVNSIYIGIGASILLENPAYGLSRIDLPSESIGFSLFRNGTRLINSVNTEEDPAFATFLIKTSGRFLRTTGRIADLCEKATKKCKQACESILRPVDQAIREDNTRLRQENITLQTERNRAYHELTFLRAQVALQDTPAHASEVEPEALEELGILRQQAIAMKQQNSDLLEKNDHLSRFNETLQEIEIATKTQLNLERDAFTEKVEQFKLAVQGLEDQITELAEEKELLQLELEDNKKAVTILQPSAKPSISVLEEERDLTLKALSALLDLKEEACKEQQKTIAELGIALRERSKELEELLDYSGGEEELNSRAFIQLQDANRALKKQEQALAEQQEKLQEFVAAVSDLYKNLENLDTEGLLGELAGHRAFCPIAERIKTLLLLGRKCVNKEREQMFLQAELSED